MRGAPCLVVALVLCGCTSAVPYRPEREIVAAIPREQAKAELARLLGVATPYVQVAWSGHNDPLRVVEVTDSGFAFRWVSNMDASDWEESRYRYAEISPEPYEYAGSYFVAFKGWSGGLMDPYPGNDCIYFARREDLEMFLEALASLSAP